jgi:uncharacterized phage infection (PIP) family protein YhgE
MGEIVVEKLVQKVSNMLEEIGEVNILVRRLTPTQETTNRINERMDALHGVLKQLEKGVTLDETKLQQLEAQTTSLGEGLQLLKKMTEEQAKAAKESKQMIGSEIAKLSQIVARLEDVTNLTLAEQKQGFSDNNKWWKVFLQERKAVMYERVVGILILLAILLILIFRFRQA